VSDKPKGEMSHEYRTLLAAILSLAVIITFSYLYKPATPPPNPNLPVSTTNAPVQNASPGQGAASPAIGSQITGISSTTPTPTPARSASAARTVVVESNLYRVELSNAGAVAHRWLLKNYKDESASPKMLDVIHADVAQQLGGWPLAVVLDDQKLETAANTALYEVTTTPEPVNGVLNAPAEVDFTWSDGHLAISKHLKFDATYIATVQVSAKFDGQPLLASVAWRGGFGDSAAERTAAYLMVFDSANAKINLLVPNKLGQPGQSAARFLQTGPLDFAGIEDQFFAAAFLPPLQTSGASAGLPDTLGAGMTLTDWSINRDVPDPKGGAPTKDLVPEMAVGSTRGEALDLRLFVGPKVLDDLKLIRPPLNELVKFGWMAIVAEPLFYLLRWIHNYIPNWGWAIFLMTVGLNMLLYPLKAKSTRSMQKMQKVAPEIRSIQDRYKKYSMRDPRKAKMNEEVMAVYSREGINPIGGCLPQLIQMPIWFGLYEMLTVTIELRQAPWILWIHDLSARDPYYILPVLMAITMYIAQKMTPMPSTDPAQARMMTLMPLMFGGMFVVFPIASGLALYIFSSYLVNMAQQWYLNRTMPVTVPKGAKKKS
jgi:YidC/Oxa1 family membrane protein insertase